MTTAVLYLLREQDKVSEELWELCVPRRLSQSIKHTVDGLDFIREIRENKQLSHLPWGEIFQSCHLRGRERKRERDILFVCVRGAPCLCQKSNKTSQASQLCHKIPAIEIHCKICLVIFYFTALIYCITCTVFRRLTGSKRLLRARRSLTSMKTANCPKLLRSHVTLSFVPQAESEKKLENFRGSLF